MQFQFFILKKNSSQQARESIFQSIPRLGGQLWMTRGSEAKWTSFPLSG
jgi:hypothetical protein